MNEREFYVIKGLFVGYSKTGPELILTCFVCTSLLDRNGIVTE